MIPTVLITTRFGKYVWYPPLQVIEFVEKGKRRGRNEHDIFLNVNNNTELRAMIAATTDMLKRLKEIKKDHDETKG